MRCSRSHCCCQHQIIGRSVMIILVALNARLNCNVVGANRAKPVMKEPLKKHPMGSVTCGTFMSVVVSTASNSPHVTNVIIRLTVDGALIKTNRLTNVSKDQLIIKVFVFKFIWLICVDCANWVHSMNPEAECTEDNTKPREWNNEEEPP